MSFVLKNTFILLIITVFKIIQSKLNNLEKLNNIRFLIDNNDFGSETENRKLENYEKNNYDYFFESIKYINPLKIFEETSNSAEEKDGFKVRCFWLDSTTMRVFDLSQLKTAKYFLLKIILINTFYLLSIIKKG